VRQIKHYSSLAEAILMNKEMMYISFKRIKFSNKERNYKLKGLPSKEIDKI